MGNVCGFEMIVVGPVSGIYEFLRIAKDHEYPRYFPDIQGIEHTMPREVADGIWSVACWGSCNWSCCKFIEGDPARTASGDLIPVWIAKLCQEEGLCVELYSDELGCEIAEHAIVTPHQCEFKRRHLECISWFEDEDPVCSDFVDEVQATLRRMGLPMLSPEYIERLARLDGYMYVGGWHHNGIKPLLTDPRLLWEAHHE